MKRLLVGFPALAVALAISPAAKADTLTFASNLSGSDVYVVDNSGPNWASPAAIPSFAGATPDTTPYDGGGWLYGPAGVAIGLPDGQGGGWVETTFTMPTVFYGASLAGLLSVDDGGCGFLNGYLIGCANYPVTEISSGLFGTLASGSSAQFNAGTNYLVFSDDNAGGGPEGMAFDGTVNYSLTPEPSTLLMLGTGLFGLAFVAFRKSRSVGTLQTL